MVMMTLTVRSSKMVDVKHDSPFNLRNTPRSKREHDSSSRSHHSSSVNGTDDAHAYPGLRHTSDSMLPTPARSRVASPSPKPSPNISRSQSATSLSRHSLADDTPEIYREPVLNARLVSLRGARKKANQRGRSRAKFGLDPHPQRDGVLAPTNGDATPEGVTTFMGDGMDANVDADTSGAEDSFADGDGDVSLNVEVPTSPLSGRPLISPLNDEEREEVCYSDCKIYRYVLSLTPSRLAISLHYVHLRSKVFRVKLPAPSTKGSKLSTLGLFLGVGASERKLVSLGQRHRYTSTSRKPTLLLDAFLECAPLAKWHQLFFKSSGITHSL